jgi:hypothetical protein
LILYLGILEKRTVGAVAGRRGAASGGHFLLPRALSDKLQLFAAFTKYRHLRSIPYPQVNDKLINLAKLNFF